VVARPVVHEERKVVTVLFADLVGFTSRSEQLDPEDVRALLSPYYAHLRSELERFGGTVEKFIGDAVMALFGAPVTHEDDPERAVRAALAIRDWVRAEERIDVRIAVNTGEALVTLGARPVEGEGMAAGDVINTAARLQSAAPVNGVLVGERTYRATHRVIDYSPANAVAAKGKELPVAAWEAIQTRSRFGVDVPDAVRTTLVGRERELGVLRDALSRLLAEPAPQLLTLIGVPGIGKSRLLHELSRLVDADQAIITWRQGRSLPYGEGVSFWALAEIFKAQAGILDSDSPEVAEQKLSDMVSEAVPDVAQGAWVRRHLRELVGVRGDSQATTNARDEAFPAWRRFVEALAEQRPFVLVFEDLHWADEGLLDFIDYLVDWVTDVPLLVVCSARPELLARRPGWGGGKPNSSTLSLPPLSDDDTARLFGDLLQRPVLPAEQQQELLLRAAGNPLFAEQYAQMLSERAAGVDLPVPETVQDLVGARLDSLPLRDKRLLQDAAVFGKVFWAGAVSALADGDDDRHDLAERLHDLARRQFLRPERRSSLGGEDQHAFLHVLLRDVAYGQMPRAARIDKHVRAATWLESLGRPDEFAEMLAHHYLSAVELMRMTAQDVSSLAEPARLALRAAGDRALALNAFPTALAHYEAALDLWPEAPTPDRALLLFGAARSEQGTDYDHEPDRLERARDALLAAGMHAEAAEAEARIAGIWWFRGQGDRCGEHCVRAQELARQGPPTAHTAYVLSEISRFRMLAGDDDLEMATEALALAEGLHLDELRSHLLITIGTMHGKSGQPGALQEIRDGLEIALTGSYINPAIRGFSNLGAVVDIVTGDQLEVRKIADESLDYARRFGAPGNVRWALSNHLTTGYEIGEWDECRRECDDFLAASAQLGGHYNDSSALRVRAGILFSRADEVGAVADITDSLARARNAQDPQILLPALVCSAEILAATGEVATAKQHFDEFLSYGTASLDVLGGETIDLAHAADVLGRRDDLRDWLGTLDYSPWFDVTRALLADDFDSALSALETMNARRLTALTQLRAAQAGAATGHSVGWHEHLHKALEFFHRVGASRYIREAEPLLPASA
jgi:class 3 adenylate cyclase/tetratricopeptide (TPR) repeat protein